MARALLLKSPAKINLALRVLGRRSDGFHALETVFERLDLADDLEFFPAAAGSIKLECDHPFVPLDRRNLVYRAAELLNEHSRTGYGVRIKITKRIPVAAGLAGGSSNGATALVGLNRFWKLGLTKTQLVALANRMGSDLAFFLNDTAVALGTGRGEIIRSLPLSCRLWHVLVTPRRPLLTKDVYGTFRKAAASSGAALTMKNRNVTMLVRALEADDAGLVRQRVFNDLEFPIAVLRPSLLKLKERMRRACDGGVCFSGSGPSVFAVMKDRASAERVADVFRRVYRQVFVVRTA